MLCAAALLLPTARAQTLEERVEALEREVQTLRAEVESLNRARTVAAPTEATKTAATEPGMATPGDGRSRIEYLLSSSPLHDDDWNGQAPLVEGAYTVSSEVLALDPRTYGVEMRAFSEYRDPSQYPSAALRLHARLVAPVTGTYEITARPRPAREGGTPVAVRMSLMLSIDGQGVVDVHEATSWSPVRAKIRLDAGEHDLRLGLVATSPGYGPSPVDSSAVLQWRPPGEAAPLPLGRFLLFP